MARRIFITVGEVSGDQIAGSLIRALKAIDPTIIVEAHGGPAMREAGATIHHETTQRAAFALRAIGRAFEVYRLLKQTRELFQRNRPDLLVCIDSFAMNYHFTKLAKSMGIPVLYYIPPQLWASRPGRIEKLRAVVDRVASILPFDAEYLRQRNVNATFVGHPLFDQLPQHRAAPVDMDGRAPVVAILSGSRKSEPVNNLPRLLEVASEIRREFPGVRFLLPTTPGTDGIVREMTKNLGDVTVGLNEIDTMLPKCDFALVKSGTSTLHVAAFGVPMIIVYYISPFIWTVLGQFVVKTRTFGLVNWLAGPENHIVPEFVPWNGPTRPVSELAISFLKDAAKRESQRADLLKMLETVGRPGASENVARMAMELMESKK